MIRDVLERIWIFWRGTAAAGGLFLILWGGLLWLSGTVPSARWGEAVRILLGGPSLPVAAPAGPGAEEWRRFGEAQRAGSEILRRRRDEVERLEGEISARLALLEAERRRAAEARRAAEEAEGRLRQREESLTAAEADAELRANLPFLSRMEGAAILSLAAEWDDARLVRYLRAMRPSKAAEVLEAMRRDPQAAGRVARVAEALQRPLRSGAPGGGP